MSTKSYTLSDILKGCTPGKIQSVGIMQIIPLISEMSDDKYISPSSGKVKVSTSGYGNLNIDNRENNKTVIVPAQAAYVVKEAAQDHAIPHTGFVKGKQTKLFNTAACIQSSQGGYISSGEHKMIILPYPLREEAHKSRKTIQYSKLWNSIEKLNSRAKAKNSGGHLNYFLESFEKQLDQFVAEFEPVDKQVGAIIMINGRIVGIERTPSYEYWLSIWPALFRECYGSLAFLEAKEVKGNIPNTRIPLRKATSLKDLKEALSEATNKEYERVKEVVESISSISLMAKQDNCEDSMVVDSLEHKRFIGQVVKDGDKIVYASLIATSDWRKNEDWYEAEPFKM